jgi:hypothetical protein
MEDADRVRTGVAAASAVGAIKEPFGLESLFGPVRQQVDSYGQRTKQEALRSFVLSCGAMVVGFGWLLIWGIVAVQAHKSDVRWMEGIVAAFGAGLSAYIARTFLSLHSTSLAERRYYHRQLLAMDLLLQAERLANVTLEKKGELYAEIVQALIRGAERILPDTPGREPSARQKSGGELSAGNAP